MQLLALPRIKQRFPEALVQIEHVRSTDGLEIQGLAFARLKNLMGSQTNLLRLVIPGDGDVGVK